MGKRAATAALSTPQQHYKTKPLHFTPPTVVTNATMPSNSLDLNRLWGGSVPRPGSQQFLQYRSRGLGC